MSKNNLPAWDLSDLYDGMDDVKFSADMDKFEKGAKAFAKKYKGKIASLSSDDFAKAIKKYEELSVLENVAAEYAYLNMVTRMKDKDAMAFYQNTSERLTDASKPLIFFALEINKLEDATLKEFLKNKKVAEYKPWLERIRRFKKYELPEEIEEVLLEKSITSSSAWVRLYEEHSSRLVYTIDGKTYNDAEIGKLLQDKDPAVREKAGKELNRVSKENEALFAFIYNMVIKDKAVDDTRRGYKRPVSERNMAENVKDETVDTLAETVKENYKNISHRFYKLKAKWLGVNKMQYWDRNAPLPFSCDRHYSWDEAVKTVLDAYKEFSPELYKTALPFFENAWIDVPPRDGKRSGAFAAGVSTTKHPYLLLNFSGKQNDVLTLAHELGHGCHMRLRQKNGELNETSRMTSEEVASVFGEMITFQSLLKKTEDDKEKLCLIASKVNDMINTAFRQIAFHFFETQAHEERKKGELSADRLAEIWVNVQKDVLGPSVIVDENSSAIWAQVGHFFFLPFYVYAYSFADCLVNSLYKVSQEGTVKDFPKKYIEMLVQTPYLEYDKLFAPFGLKPSQPDFWNKGLSLISDYIDELERLNKKFGL